METSKNLRGSFSRRPNANLQVHRLDDRGGNIYVVVQAKLGTGDADLKFH